MNYRTLLYFIPLALYLIFVILMVIGFVFVAKYRNCVKFRLEDPKCFTDWQCSGTSDDGLSPVERFKQYQNECGAKAISDHVRQFQTLPERQCEALKFIHRSHCKNRWTKDYPKALKLQIKDDTRDALNDLPDCTIPGFN